MSRHGKLQKSLGVDMEGHPSASKELLFISWVIGTGLDFGLDRSLHSPAHTKTIVLDVGN